MRKSYAPPSAIHVKPPKFETKRLQDCYEWIGYDKHTAMSLALDWYAQNVPMLLFGAPLTPEQMSTYNKSEKSVKLGQRTDVIQEKEQAWRTALRCFEKIWADRYNLPKFDVLEAAPVTSARVQKSVSVIQALNKAFKNLGIEYVPVVSEKRELVPGPVAVESFPHQQYRVHIPLKDLDGMAKQAPLQTAFAEFTYVVRAASMKQQVDGTQKVDGGTLFRDAIPQALSNLYIWAEDNHKDLFKGMGPVAAAAAPKVGKHKAYKSGSAQEAVYNLLIDGLQHSIGECKTVAAATGTKYPSDGLYYVTKDGNKYGTWTINKVKNRFADGGSYVTMTVKA